MLEQQLLAVSDRLGEQGVAVAILALAKMEVCWNTHLAEKTQEVCRLSSSINRTSLNFSI